MATLNSPLENTWVLSLVPRNADYSLGQSVHETLHAKIDTIKLLMCVPDNPDLRLSYGHYFLFKKGIEPTFEAPENRNGGRWNFSFRNLEDLVEGWRTLVFASGGMSLFKDIALCDDIAGLQLLYNKLSVKLWMKTAEKIESRELAEFPFEQGILEYLPAISTVQWQSNQVSVTPSALPLAKSSVRAISGGAKHPGAERPRFTVRAPRATQRVFPRS